MTPGISPSDRSGRTPPTGSGNQQGGGIESATPSARITQASSEEPVPQGNPISGGAMSPSPTLLTVNPPQRNPFLRAYERTGAGTGARSKTTNRRTGKQAGGKHTKIDMPDDDNKKNKGTGSKFPFKRLAVGAMVLAGGAAARYLMSSPGGGIGGGGSGGNGLIPGGNDLGRHGPDFGGVGGGAEGGVETGGDSGNLGADELFPMPTSTQTADDAALGAAWLDAAGAGGGGRGHRRNRRPKRETVHEMPTPQPIRGGIPINNRGSTKGLASVEMPNGVSCSGVLISPHHVATAQHCVTKEGKVEGSKDKTFLGFEDPWTIKVRFTNGDKKANVREHQVPRYYFQQGFFPGYRRGTVSKINDIKNWRPNDIAILEIHPPVTDYDNTHEAYPYVQMANSTIRQKAIAKCNQRETMVRYFIQGFGLVRDGDDPDIAREMQVKCSRVDRDLGRESFLTFNARPNESSQPGDSGGPLIVQVEDGSRHSIGVMTHGNDQGDSYSSSFNYHQDFIDAVINEREAGQAVVGCIRTVETQPWFVWNSMSTVEMVNICSSPQTAHIMIGDSGDREGGTARLNFPRLGSRQRFSKGRYKPMVVYSTYRDNRPKPTKPPTTTRPPTTTGPATTPGTTLPTSPPTTVSPYADRNVRVGLINSAPNISANMTVTYDLNGNRTEINILGVATNATAEVPIPKGASNITMTFSPSDERRRLNPNIRGYEVGSGVAVSFDDYCYKLTDANEDQALTDDDGNVIPVYEINFGSEDCVWLNATTAETLTEITTPFGESESGNGVEVLDMSDSFNDSFNITTRVTQPPENTTVTALPGIEDMSGSGEGSGSGSDELTFPGVLLTTRDPLDISSRVTATPENTSVTQAPLFRNNTTLFRNSSNSADAADD